MNMIRQTCPTHRCFLFVFVRVTGLLRDKVCVLSVCVFTLSHAYTQAEKHLYQRRITQG